MELESIIEQLATFGTTYGLKIIGAIIILAATLDRLKNK